MAVGKIDGLSRDEVKVDIISGPMNVGNFRSGWWPVECRGVKYRVYSSLSAYCDLDKQREAVTNVAFKALSSGTGSAELANHPHR